MYRIRLRFTKTDYMKFISHLDLARMMERALRRANVPLAFSQGFNPHPKISFATALALGVSSEGEYMDIETEKEIELSIFKDKMNEELPQGIHIIQCKYIDLKEKALMAVIDYSTYIVKCQLGNEVSEDILNNGIKDLLGYREIIVNKNTKKKNKVTVQELNIRPFIYNMELMNKHDLDIIFKMTLSTGSRGNLKPEVLMEKFRELTDIPILHDSIRIHRLDLYGVKDDAFLTPLAITT